MTPEQITFLESYLPKEGERDNKRSAALRQLLKEHAILFDVVSDLATNLSAASIARYACKTAIQQIQDMPNDEQRVA